MVRSDYGLVLACACATAAPVVVLVDGVDPLLRLLIALPMVVIVPGYALMAATLPGPSLSGVERLVLSIGTSMAMTVLGGLFLNVTPWGLQPVTWVCLLSGLTMAAAAAAIKRRR